MLSVDLLYLFLYFGRILLLHRDGVLSLQKYDVNRIE